MATIPSPTPQEVYDAAGHNLSKGLSFDHFGRSTDKQVLDMIAAQILPPVVVRVDGEADDAAEPLDFPFTDVIWLQARPGMDPATVTQQNATQAARFTYAMRDIAAADLLGRVETKDPFWIARAVDLRAAGEAMLVTAKTSINNIVVRVKAGQDAGRSGFGLVQINVEPARRFSEFGGVDFGNGNP